MRRRGLVAIGVAIALGLAATAQGQTPQRGGTLVFGVGGEPNTFDCHATNTFAVLHYVAPHYSTLLRYDPESYPRIVGDVAQSWSSSADRLTWTFKLRAGVVFHDGTPLTAADVKATLERLRNPPPSTPRSSPRWRARGTASIPRRSSQPIPSIRIAASWAPGRSSSSTTSRARSGTGGASTPISAMASLFSMASRPCRSKDRRWSMRSRPGICRRSSAASRRRSATASMPRAATGAASTREIASASTSSPSDAHERLQPV